MHHIFAERRQRDFRNMGERKTWVTIADPPHPSRTSLHGSLSGWSQQPDNVVSIRGLKLQKMFSIRRFSRRRAATSNWNDPYWQDMVCDWEDDGRPLPLPCRMLVGRGGKTGRLFPLARLQRNLERMQRNLIW